LSQREKWRHLIPTSLLQVTVHPDWEAVERRARARDARLRIVLQLVVIGVGLLAALLSALDGDAGAARLAETILFTLAFVCFPLWASLWRLDVRDRRRWPALAGIVAAAAVALLSTPAALRTPAWLVLPHWPPYLALLSPLATWGGLYWLGRDRPGFLAGLGLGQGSEVLHQVAIGLALGATLGLHLTAVVASAPLRLPLQAPGLPALGWSLLFALGVYAAGQELTFRGLLFGLLSRGQPVRAARIITFIVALNVLVHSASTFGAADPALWLLLLAYEAVFALMATGLRNYHGSIWPSLAMNVVYHLFAAGMLR